MAQQKLNQLLKTQISELKSFANANDASGIFILDTISCSEEEIENLVEPQEHTICGRIFPKSAVFKDSAFKIEIKLSMFHPFYPPKVRFLTPIYHLNVSKDGEFDHELLQKTARWSNNTSLIDAIKAIVDRIDNPEIYSALNNGIVHC
ncbi:hypothetical protein I4U23_001854 [Adineta vaga]|nr:hypothetical protein I4U23_001854 [Adineta vaga]